MKRLDHQSDVDDHSHFHADGLGFVEEARCRDDLEDALAIPLDVTADEFALYRGRRRIGPDSSARGVVFCVGGVGQYLRTDRSGRLATIHGVSDATHCEA